LPFKIFWAILLAQGRNRVPAIFVNAGLREEEKNMLRNTASVGGKRAAAAAAIILLVCLSGANAVSVGLSGSSNSLCASGGGKYDLGGSSMMRETSTIDFRDGLSILQSGTARIDHGGGGIRQYKSVSKIPVSAAYFAYLTDSDSASWKGYAEIKGSNAEAKQDIVMVNGHDPFFGVIAINMEENYASSQLIGGYPFSGTPVSMIYSALAKATPTSAEASTTVKNTDGGFFVTTWAEDSPDYLKEVFSESSLWSGGSPVFGPKYVVQHNRISLSRASFFAAKLTKGTFAAKASNTASSAKAEISAISIKSAWLTIQSGKDGTLESWKSDANNGLGIENADLSYKSQTSTSAADAKSSQTLAIKVADVIQRWSNAWASTYSGYLTYGATMAMANGAIKAMMKSKDTAISKANYASVTEDLEAKGAYIDRGYSWEGLYAKDALSRSAATFIRAGDRAATAQSSLKGKAIATSDAVNGAKITGSWAATSAAGLMSYRKTQASNGAISPYIEGKNPGTWKFTELGWSKTGYVYAA
jgi:hypothetical protein